MSYFYATRFVGPITPLVEELRQEIYCEPYSEINWSTVRHSCAKVSLLFCSLVHIRNFNIMVLKFYSHTQADFAVHC